MKPELRKEIEKKVLEAVWKEAKKPLPEYKWEISVRVYYGENGLRGFASISYPGILEISGLQIKEREGKLQVVYPYGFQGNQLISWPSQRIFFQKTGLRRKYWRLISRRFHISKR